MKLPWLSPGSAPPGLETPALRCRPLKMADVVKDYDAVMSSRSDIQFVFGPDVDWPTAELSVEQGAFWAWQLRRDHVGPLSRADARAFFLVLSVACVATLVDFRHGGPGVAPEGCACPQSEQRPLPRSVPFHVFRTSRCPTHSLPAANTHLSRPEWELSLSYTYTVMSLDESICLGCVYVMPPEKQGFDAQVIYWARSGQRAPAGAASLEAHLGQALHTWLASPAWPFKAVAWPGREIPWEKWVAMPPPGGA